MKRKSSWTARARSAKRRRTARKPTLNRRVNKILRFIKNNKPEVKKATYRVTAADLSGGLCVTYNLMYHMMSQGDAENQFAGKSINLKGIGIKAIVTNEAIANAIPGFNACDFKALISLIGHKQYATTSSISITNINATEFGTFSTYRPHYDADKVKIYKQLAFHHRGVAAGGLSTTPVGAPDQLAGHVRAYTKSTYVKMNRKLTFERFTTDYALKGNNLYLLVQSDYIGPTFTTIGEYSFDVTLYYTDD